MPNSQGRGPAPGHRPLHSKHGNRTLADMEPSAPPASVAPVRALGLLALLVTGIGLVLALGAKHRVHPLGDATGLTSCARPIEQRFHVAKPPALAVVPAGPPVGELVCADALVLPQHQQLQLQAGDAWVQDANGRWARHPHGMAAPLRLMLDLPLHLNRASAQELALIGGLNGRQARAIVAHRERLGPFDSVEALLQVHGVGKKTLHRVAPHLQVGTVEPSEGEPSAQVGLAPLPLQGASKSWQPPASYAKRGRVQREWLVDVVARLPQGTISRMWGWLARRRWPVSFVRLYQRSFVRAVGIDMAESEFALHSYPSLQDLFGRRLKPGLRPIDGDLAAVVSPVDAHVGQCGLVEQGTLLQVKGRSYSLARLLGDEARARAYEGGAYATFYLAPRDYHRIHAPITGTVSDAKLIPGSLFPVFEESLHKVDELFARNERIITYLRDAHDDHPDAGQLAIIKVGATLVGCITTAYDASLRGNVRGETERAPHYAPPHRLERGQELGAFELGSTVVLVAPPGKVVLANMTFGQPIRMGERIGTLLPTAVQQVQAAPPSAAPTPQGP